MLCVLSLAVLFGNHPLRLKGNITILLPNNFFFSRYKFDALTSDLIGSLLNFHILAHKYKYKALKKTPTNSLLPSKHLGNSIRRNDNSDVIELEAVEGAHGPRREAEQRCKVTKPNIFVGPSVAIHGLSCVLTPPEFEGGPFTTATL